MAIRFIVKQTPVPPGPGGDKDDSSYDRTFTLVGTADPTFNENSKIGTACLKFIGNDQKLTSPANANWNLGTTFTIDFWMRFHPFYWFDLQTNGGCKIISNHEGGGETPEQGYEIGLTLDGNLYATYHGDTGKGGVQTYSVATVGDGDIVMNGGWHHVCFQRGTEGESNVMRLFLDGVMKDSETAQGTYVHNTVTANPFTIGARANVSPTIDLPFLYGTLDELEIIDGVAKFNTAGFTPPTIASTSTANHLLLMHFDDDTPLPTVWYDATYYAPAQYWFMGGGESWSGTAWTGYAATWTGQYGWQSKFRPEKIRIAGTAIGGGTIVVTNNAQDFTIASGSAASVLQMDTTFESEDVTSDDIKYLQNMTQFSQVTAVLVDAKPIPPEAA